MIEAIEHIAICARDTKTLTEWYVKNFNFTIIDDNGKGNYFVKAPGGVIFEIMKFTSGVQPQNTSAIGLRHIAISVSKENFDIEVQKVRDMKLKIEADVTESPNGVKTFFFRDPEGNVLHFIYRPTQL